MTYRVATVSGTMMVRVKTDLVAEVVIVTHSETDADEAAGSATQPQR